MGVCCLVSYDELLRSDMNNEATSGFDSLLMDICVYRVEVNTDTGHGFYALLVSEVPP